MPRRRRPSKMMMMVVVIVHNPDGRIVRSLSIPINLSLTRSTSSSVSRGRTNERTDGRTGEPLAREHTDTNETTERRSVVAHFVAVVDPLQQRMLFGETREQQDREHPFVAKFVACSSCSRDVPDNDAPDPCWCCCARVCVNCTARHFRPKGSEHHRARQTNRSSRLLSSPCSCLPAAAACASAPKLVNCI